MKRTLPRQEFRSARQGTRQGTAGDSHFHTGHGRAQGTAGDSHFHIS